MGTPGDAMVLEPRGEPIEHVDMVGEMLRGDRRLTSVGSVIGGRWWSDATIPPPPTRR